MTVEDLFDAERELRGAARAFSKEKVTVAEAKRLRKAAMAYGKLAMLFDIVLDIVLDSWTENEVTRDSPGPTTAPQTSPDPQSHPPPGPATPET